MFTDFVKSELTEDQLLPLLRRLLPILLNILGDHEVQSVAACIRAGLIIYVNATASLSPYSRPHRLCL